MQPIESAAWDRRVRVLFWIVGLCAGLVLTYTTRFYLNGDGINYIEMGDSLRDGYWSGLVNTTESPAYAFLMGLGHMVLQTTVLNELPLLKAVNLLVFVIAMAACDLFVSGLRTDVEALGSDREKPLPFAGVSAVSYAVFLFLALGWVRVRLVAPDMMVFALYLVSMWFMVKIRRDPDSFANFLGLGICTGLCYLGKSFFFLFSVFVFGLAAVLTLSLRKAIPRIGLAAASMLIVASPLLIGLSAKVGHFSYGEVGNFGYVNNLASTGEPVHKPERLHTAPLVELYRNGPGKTFPMGFDLAYWTEGMKPRFDAAIHWRALVANLQELWSFSSSLIVGAMLWLVFQWHIGRLEWGRMWPPSLWLVLTLLSIPAVAMYCLIHVEHRYVAGFFFFPFAALPLIPRYKLDDDAAQRKALLSVAAMSIFLLAGVVQSGIDQSLRGLCTRESKLSHRDAYAEFSSINAFLDKNRVRAGDEVAVMGTDPLPPIYWARMAGIRVTGVFVQEKEVIQSSPQDRKRALASLRNQGIKAVVAKGASVARLTQEGWQLVPGTQDYYVYIL